MNSSDYYRRRAGSRRSREREEGDAVATALTLQVILAVILILAAVIAKKTDEVKFSEFRAQYRVMATDPAEGEKVWGLFSGSGWQQIFAGLEDAASSALAKLTGAEQPEVPTEPPTEDENEPQPELEIVTEPTEGSGDIPAFSYDNLVKPQVMASLGELEEGGLRAAAMSFKPTGGAAVPVGCTMAPVTLRGTLQPPVTGIVTSGFAYREHPITGENDFHNGMDIAAVEGGDVLAAMPGEVTETGWSEVYGNYLVLRHAANFETFYGHCAALLAEQGDSILRGQAIATVGDTGVTTGPHLHFSVLVSGLFTDPYWVLRDSIRQVQ
jgi:murein DD-endopeptidase MepM/ murein hydrolase activator NlpD